MFKSTSGQGRGANTGRGAQMTRPGDEARPKIWVDGRQSPKFAPKTFTTASLLLARAAADRGLSRFAGLAASLEKGIAGQVRATRPDPTVLARAQAIAALLLERIAAQARVAGGLLAPRPKASPPVPVAPPVPPAAAAPVARQTGPRQSEPRRSEPASSHDPDLQAIRAMLRAEHSDRRPASTASARFATVASVETRRRPGRALRHGQALYRASGHAVEWLFAHLLAATALCIAAPFGLAVALYRHLDGENLQELVEDCRQNRGQ